MTAHPTPDELATVLPAPPTVTFASDNAAGVHPRVMQALVAANEGHAVAYGHDRWSRRLTDAMRERFGAPVEVLPVWGGTGANVVALACLTHASDAVVCTDTSHIHVDEAGAPERMAGTKLLAVATTDGKLRPDDLRAHAAWRGDEHHPQPKVVSITQSTEVGTLYSPDEIAALADTAHSLGMYVHLDGARIANAVAALGGDLRATTIGAGVDVISFGGTKNGMMYGEAVVFCAPELASRAVFVRKQLAQLPSKARFIAAQMLALFDDDLWLQLAAHANGMTARLAAAVADVPGLELAGAPVVNSIFPRLPRAAIAPLQRWCPFYTWDDAEARVRWMTAWDTTADDVDAFAGGVRTLLDRLARDEA
ncbi:MAG TPA: beta-eliminating lyase-related protein [Acidimicrobiia bacterium]|nr:beta-eliminating lyase-related protein [Acidimicrobiia bacterium]